MNEFLVLLLSLSISSSLIGLLLFALKPLYRNRLSKTWQYYIWLIVVARLLLPFAPETNLMGYLFQRAEQPVESIALPETRQGIRPTVPAYTVPDEAAETPEAPDTVKSDADINTTFQLKTVLKQNLFTIWLVVALVLFVRKLTSYLSFIRYIRAGSHQADRPEMLDIYFAVCEESEVSKPIPIHENKLASSPMLVGMMRPCIVLPELHLDTESLRLILRHELIHHKRRDILYKWLVQLVLCVYWFNPLIYLVSREVNRNCELSCDEVVIRQMTDTDKRRYGDTLLAALKAGGVYGNAVAPITLTEDGKTMKERLQAILKHHSGSTWTKIAAVVLSVSLLCGASFTGAYAGAKRSYVTESYVQPALQPVAGQMTEQKAATPTIMKQDEYAYIMTVSRGETISKSFQSSGAYTALLLNQEGKGAITITVRDQAGNMPVDITAAIYENNKNPTVFETDAHAVYAVEVKVPENGPDKVTVYGSGITGADYVGVEPFNIEKQAATFGENLAREITNHTLDFAFGNIEKWAEQLPEQWGNQWNSYYGNNGESWRYLKYLYEDGYLVGVGIRYNDSLNNYSTTETVTLNGKTYTIAYSPAAANYAGNDKIRSLIEKTITEKLFKDSNDAQNRIYFTVRSVTYNTDPQDLLRSLYRDKAFIEFIEVVGYCKGLPVIEELLDKAADDQQGIYFLFLADQLPDNFSVANAEVLARKAVKNQDIVMLSALERFLPKSLYESLMQEALGLDNFNFNFDFGLN